VRRKILNCINLIGDSLYLLGPVKKFLDKYPDEASCILVQPNISGELFARCFHQRIPVVFSEQSAREIDPDAVEFRIESGPVGAICFQKARETGRQWHISEGYAHLLGVDMEGCITPITDWFYYPNQRFDTEKLAILSPFSRSCTRHGGMRPNKTLDDYKWEPIIRFLRRHGYKVKVSCGPKDRLKNCSILESDYLQSYTLKDMEMDFRKASLTISVDNGLAHMSSSIGTKTIVLWPPASCEEFIAPVWSPNTTLVHMGDPNLVHPFQLLTGIRKMLVWLEDGKR
jgi:hypothetical protein